MYIKKRSSDSMAAWANRTERNYNYINRNKNGKRQLTPQEQEIADLNLKRNFYKAGINQKLQIQAEIMSQKLTEFPLTEKDIIADNFKADYTKCDRCPNPNKCQPLLTTCLGGSLKLA